MEDVNHTSIFWRAMWLGTSCAGDSWRHWRLNGKQFCRSQGLCMSRVCPCNGEGQYIQSCITKNVTSRLREEIIPLSSAYVRNAWNTVQFSNPQKKDIEILEWVQQRATKMQGSGAWSAWTRRRGWWEVDLLNPKRWFRGGLCCFCQLPGKKTQSKWRQTPLKYLVIGQEEKSRTETQKVPIRY